MSGAKKKRAVRESVQRVLLAVVVRLRRLFVQRAPEFYGRFPNARRQCSTCAFNPRTDGDRGFDTTILGLARALLRDEPFYCHDNLPRDRTGEWMFDPRVAVLCSGAEVVRCQDAKREVARGFAGEYASGTGLADDAKADAAAELLADRLPSLAPRKVVRP